MPSSRSGLHVRASAEMREDRPLRLGMVGGGLGAFIGAVHRSAARLDNRFDLVAGALSDKPDEAQESARMLRIAPDRAYMTFEEMAEVESGRADGIDVVSIVTPNHLHFAIGKAFAEKGIHVICDKPLAVSLEQGRTLARIVDKVGIVFCVTHNYTGYPMVREARALVAAGELGSIRSVRVSYSQQWLTDALEQTDNRQAKWRQDPALGGPAGCIGDIGSHAYSLAAFVTGLELESVCAELTTFVSGRRVDDHAQVMLRYEGGARGLLWASQVAPGEDQNLELAVYGKFGGLVWRHEAPDRLTVTRYGDRPQILTRGGPGMSESAARASRLPAGLPEGYFECFANLYSDVSETIIAQIGGAPLSTTHFPSIEDGVKVLEFIDASLRSSHAGATWTRPT